MIDEKEWLAAGYPIDVHLRDPQTGRTGVYHATGYPDEYGDGPFSDFIWSEGNYSCDHNRVLFLYGRDSPESEDEESFNCTTERIIIDKIVRVSDGLILYREEDA